MFNCRKVKPVIVTPPTMPEINENTGLLNATIGIVVGHNERAQGANNYNDESEWVFNSRIAKKLQNKLDDAGVRSVIVFRPKTGGYKHECRSVRDELKKQGCKFSIHLHFNSAGKGAMGCEVLVAQTRTMLDDQWAKVFTDMLNERYEFIERRNDGVFTVSSGHNGAGMLYKVRDAGIIPVLVEPCFADYRTKESMLIFEQEDKYVDVLRDAVLATWK